MRETWVAGSLASSARTKEERVGPRGSSRAKSDLAVGHDQDLVRPYSGLAYLVDVIDCCTREIAGWKLSHRCRTEDALAAVEQVVLADALHAQIPPIHSLLL
jgi:transposase InsO family protein